MPYPCSFRKHRLFFTWTSLKISQLHTSQPFVLPILYPFPQSTMKRLLHTLNVKWPLAPKVSKELLFMCYQRSWKHDPVLSQKFAKWVIETIYSAYEIDRILLSETSPSHSFHQSCGRLYCFSEVSATTGCLQGGKLVTTIGISITVEWFGLSMMHLWDMLCFLEIPPTGEWTNQLITHVSDSQWRRRNCLPVTVLYVGHLWTHTLHHSPLCPSHLLYTC